MISLTQYFFSDFFPFNSLKSRYNKFSDTYLVKIDDLLSIELPPFLTMSLYTYQRNNDIHDTITTLKSIDSHWNSPNDDYSFISWIHELYYDVEFEKKTPLWIGTPFRIRKIMNFSFFNPILRLIVPFRAIIILLSILIIISFWSNKGSLIVIELMTNRRVLYDQIYLILPTFYISRLFFTPIHEFGHNFWYYMYQKQSGTFFISIKGFMRFQGITDLPDLLYLPKTYQRILVSLGGIWAELLTLTMLLIVFPELQLSFFGLVISLRIFISLIWNMNLLSSQSDGNKMISDVIGFPTLGDYYSEFLISKIARTPLKESLFNRRVKTTLIFYIVFALSFTGLFLLLQLNYFGRIFLKLIDPSIFLLTLNWTTTFPLIIISYLYFSDFLIFSLKRILIYYRLIKRRKNN